MIGGKLYDFDYTAQSPKDVWGAAVKDIKGNASAYASMMLRQKLQELLNQQGQSQDTSGLASLTNPQGYQDINSLLNNFNNLGIASLLFK